VSKAARVSLGWRHQHVRGFFAIGVADLDPRPEPDDPVARRCVVDRFGRSQ